MSSSSIFRFGLLFLLILSACDSTGMGDDDALDRPMLVSPASAEETADAVLLDWDDVTNAKRYHVQLADSPDFNSPLIDQTVMARSRHVATNLERDTVYYWRIMALSDSESSPWSSTRSFTPTRSATLPEYPALSLPHNGTDGLERSVRLEWESPEGAISYHLVVTMDEQMLLFQTDLEEIEDAFFKLEGLIFTYPYWWKVRSLGPAGYSEWSPVWIFQVKDGE